MTTIRTPLSNEEGITRLEVIDELVTSKGWERAAILATIVRLPGQGSRTDLATSPNAGKFLTAEQFADLGISGLRKADTVRKYVQRWLDANGEYPEYGAKVDLPVKRWPPVDPSDGGSRATPSNIERMVRENREHAEAAIRGLAEGGLDHVDDGSVEKLVHGAATARPVPTRAGVGRELNDRAGDAPFDSPPRPYPDAPRDEMRMDVHRDQAALAGAIARIKWDFDDPARREHLEPEVIRAAYDDLANLIAELEGAVV